MYAENLSALIEGGELGSIGMPAMDEQFGEWLRARRRASGLSLRDAARTVGVSATAFQKWENGTIRPRANKVEGLARLFATEGTEFSGPANKIALRPASAARLVARRTTQHSDPAPESGREDDLRTRIEVSKRAIASAAGISPDRVKIIIEY